MSTRKTKSENENPTGAPRRRKTAAAESSVTATPKVTRTRRVAAVAPGVTQAPDSATSRPVAPTHDDIAIRAYFIAVERGGPGDPVADWLLAEQQLRQL